MALVASKACRCRYCANSRSHQSDLILRFAMSHMLHHSRRKFILILSCGSFAHIARRLRKIHMPMKRNPVLVASR